MLLRIKPVLAGLLALGTLFGAVLASSAKPAKAWTHGTATGTGCSNAFDLSQTCNSQYAGYMRF